MEGNLQGPSQLGMRISTIEDRRPHRAGRSQRAALLLRPFVIVKAFRNGINQCYLVPKSSSPQRYIALKNNAFLFLNCKILVQISEPGPTAEIPMETDHRKKAFNESDVSRSATSQSFFEKIKVIFIPSMSPSPTRAS